MRFGCFASLVLWLAVASVWSGSMVPIAVAVLMIGFLIVYRGLDSERPLY